MECYGDINEDYFSKFGLYSGKSLENAPSPSGGWFTFFTLPMNNNIKYALQIGFYNSNNTVHYMVRMKINESWNGVKWKEFNISYKEYN